MRNTGMTFLHGRIFDYRFASTTFGGTEHELTSHSEPTVQEAASVPDQPTSEGVVQSHLDYLIAFPVFNCTQLSDSVITDK